MQPESSSFFEQGLARLQSPLLPLVHIVQWLYLSGPFTDIADLLAEFNEPIEMDHATYQNPGTLLTEHVQALRHLERLKKQGGKEEYRIYAEDGSTLDGLEAIGQWTRHLILSLELETINSLLCATQGCTLCCTGPSSEQEQFFFEIPLLPEETTLFALPRYETAESRVASPHDGTIFRINDQPFYAGPPAIYHWRTGWSLILPRHENCPQLNEAGACRIYPRRPDVCRRPQIFPFLLERTPDRDAGGEKAYVLRSKLLAIWDCPYVRRLQEDIAAFAERCGLEPVFRENKA